MNSSTEPVTLHRWIEGDGFVVEVEVEGLSVNDKPYLMLDTVRYLDDVKKLANARNFAELEKHGTIYMRRSA